MWKKSILYKGGVEPYNKADQPQAQLANISTNKHLVEPSEHTLLLVLEF